MLHNVVIVSKLHNYKHNNKQLVVLRFRYNYYRYGSNSTTFDGKRKGTILKNKFHLKICLDKGKELGNGTK